MSRKLPRYRGTSGDIRIAVFIPQHVRPRRIGPKNCPVSRKSAMTQFGDQTELHFIQKSRGPKTYRPPPNDRKHHVLRHPDASAAGDGRPDAGIGNEYRVSYKSPPNLHFSILPTRPSGSNAEAQEPRSATPGRRPRLPPSPWGKLESRASASSTDKRDVRRKNRQGRRDPTCTFSPKRETMGA